MKIIFLDIDGVLNNAAAFAKASAAGIASVETLDDDCIRRLRTLVNACFPDRVAIVLSSSWRFSADLVDVLEFRLRAFGLRIDSRTTLQGSEQRGTQIAQWLANQPTIIDPQILILDDDHELEFLPAQLPFLVQTNMATGLTDENVVQAARILGITLPE